MAKIHRIAIAISLEWPVSHHHDLVRGILDFAERRGYRVAEALVAKAEYNKTRERKHGGKRF